VLIAVAVYEPSLRTISERQIVGVRHDVHRECLTAQFDLGQLVNRSHVVGIIDVDCVGDSPVVVPTATDLASMKAGGNERINVLVSQRRLREVWVARHQDGAPKYLRVTVTEAGYWVRPDKTDSHAVPKNIADNLSRQVILQHDTHCSPSVQIGRCDTFPICSPYSRSLGASEFVDSGKPIGFITHLH
jgi:hypothetical protein